MDVFKACEKGDYDALTQLIFEGARVDGFTSEIEQDNDGVVYAIKRSPICVATFNKHTRIVLLLLALDVTEDLTMVVVLALYVGALDILQVIFPNESLDFLASESVKLRNKYKRITYAES